MITREKRIFLFVLHMRNGGVNGVSMWLREGEEARRGGRRCVC